MGVESTDVSVVVVRTMDGLRVAVAGLAREMPVELEGVVIDALTVGELRDLTSLPHPLRVQIPYRLRDDSRVHVSVADPGER